MRLTNTVITIAVLTYAAIVSLLWCVSGHLDHDEHQFMASAFMVAQYGLHPYQDFAYFHMPNLVYLYAPFFFTPYPFMLARIFVGICGFGICLTIFLYARSLLSGYDKLTYLIIPICITVLLLHSPLYRHATSHVWNHTPSTFFALLAFLLHCRGIRLKSLTILFFSGISLGMAIGIRLSFAPLIIPFLLVITFSPVGTFKTKGLQLFAFGVGGLFANVAAIFFFFTSYQDFWFGNVGYAELNTLYREEMSYSRAMTLAGKFKYLIKIFFKKPSELLAVLVYLYSLVLFAIDRNRSTERPKFELLFLLLSLPFLFLGCLAPTPSFHQYYFALIPFLMLLSLHALSNRRNKAFSGAVVLPFVLVASISFVYDSPFTHSSTINVFTRPQSLTPIKLQGEAEVLRSYIESKEREGKVLTLSPLYAVNSKLPIYEEFVTGPFAWRVSHLLSEEDAINRGLPLRSRIKSFVKERRPCAILTGKEIKELEILLMTVGHELGYQHIKTPSGIVIWLSAE